jgi:hypothetical protein
VIPKALNNAAGGILYGAAPNAAVNVFDIVYIIKARLGLQYLSCLYGDQMEV